MPYGPSNPEPAWSVCRRFREEVQQKASSTGRRVVGDSILGNTLRLTVEAPDGSREVFAMNLPPNFRQ